MPILGPYSRPVQWSPEIRVLTSPPGDFDAYLNLRTTDIMVKSMGSGVRQPEPGFAVCLFAGDLGKLLNYSSLSFTVGKMKQQQNGSQNAVWIKRMYVVPSMVV